LSGVKPVTAGYPVAFVATVRAGGRPMPVRTPRPPATDVVAMALKVLVAQGMTGAAAQSALIAMAQERGLPVARCAALVVAAVDGRMG
jgi:hypothetical protein